MRITGAVPEEARAGRSGPPDLALTVRCGPAASCARLDRRGQSAEGFELTWATNHLAPFLLTELLLPLVVAAPAGRIVNVVSEFYGRRLDTGNLQGERKYSYFGAYRASKLGEVLFSAELARRIKGSGVTVVSVSPGPAKTHFTMPSGLLGVVLGVMQRTPMFKPAGQAAEGIVWAATAPELAGNSGALYLRGKQLSLKGAANDPSLAARVWSISEQQTGINTARSAVTAVSAASHPDAQRSRHTSQGPDGPGSSDPGRTPEAGSPEAPAPTAETRPHITRPRAR